ncbi:hypothetical protein RM553_05585 [Zunongwangia sp. F363]|uniref:Uncharacterized protein n=1 Tax=Autumnicola tepida TaxID=3075595 RepID=A0ABU3C7L1_9FLAO|nr:hypothetical protein [Zunongwangia sp. F363]MDT0642299.1 hypothetical protein [Zunongwangia sp. F363]
MLVKKINKKALTGIQKIIVLSAQRSTGIIFSTKEVKAGFLKKYKNFSVRAQWDLQRRSHEKRFAGNRLKACIFLPTLLGRSKT